MLNENFLRRASTVVAAAVLVVFAAGLCMKSFAAEDAGKVMHISSFKDYQVLCGDDTGLDMLVYQSGTIVLDNDINLAKNQTFYFGSGTYILDLNGHSITKIVKKDRDYDNESIIATGWKEQFGDPITKLTVKGNGEIKYEGESMQSIFFIHDTSDVKIQNGTFMGGSVLDVVGDWSGINRRTRVTINGGNFTSTGEYYAITNNDANLVINGGTFIASDTKYNDSKTFPGTYSHGLIDNEGARSVTTINGGVFNNSSSEMPMFSAGHINIKGGMFAGRVLFSADTYPDWPENRKPYIKISGGNFTKCKRFDKKDKDDRISLDKKHLTYTKAAKFTASVKNQMKAAIKRGNKVAANTKKYAPKRVAISKLTTKSKAATIKWKKVKNASGYIIEMSRDEDVYEGKASRIFYSADKTITVKKYSAKGKTIKKLEKGKTYWFRVRAYRNVKGNEYYGAWSKAKKIKIK